MGGVKNCKQSSFNKTRNSWTVIATVEWKVHGFGLLAVQPQNPQGGRETSVKYTDYTFAWPSMTF